MCNIARFTSVVCVHLTLVVLHLTAGPVAPESIPSLTSRADGIVIGSFQAVRLNGSITAVIKAEEVLKGAIVPGVSISVSWPQPRWQQDLPSVDGPASSGHGIFFLRQDASGPWSILPVTRGDADWEDTYIHTIPNVPSGIRDVASSSLPSVASPFDQVLLEMVVNREAGAPMPFDLVATYRERQSPVLAAAFARFLTNQDPTLMSIGLRGSILSGDPSLILRVRQKYATLSTAGGWRPLLDEIKYYYSNAGTQAIQTLGQAATDGTVGMDLRIATAVALARMHTQQTLPYLAALLDDPNPTLKTAAVGGMASFANNVPIGSHEPAAGAWQYRTDDTIAHSAFDEATVERQESYYITFWKGWWQQNQKALAL